MRLTKIAGVVGALVLVAGLVFVGAQQTSAQASATIAFVDTVRLLNELPQMTELKALLEEETQKKQVQYDAEAAKLQDDEAKRQLFEKYQEDLDARKDALFAQALEETNKLIAKVAKEEKVDVVLDKQSLLYGGLDLTDKVLEAAKGSK